MSLAAQGKYPLVVIPAAKCSCRFFSKKALPETTLYETMDIHRLQGKKGSKKERRGVMGYPTKIQQISRQKGNQWYVNFPNALAEAMNFTKGETVEWEVDSLTALRMIRTEKPRSTPVTKRKSTKTGKR